MKKMSAFNWVVFLLVVIGAINWGLIGLLGYDLVAALLGAGTAITKAVYTLVGIAGLVKIANVIKS